MRCFEIYLGDHRTDEYICFTDEIGMGITFDISNHLSLENHYYKPIRVVDMTEIKQSKFIIAKIINSN